MEVTLSLNPEVEKGLLARAQERSDSDPTPSKPRPASYL